MNANVNAEILKKRQLVKCDLLRVNGVENVN